MGRVWGIVKEGSGKTFREAELKFGVPGQEGVLWPEPRKKGFLEETMAGTKAWHHNHPPGLACFCGRHTLPITARNTGAISRPKITSETSCSPTLVFLLGPCRMAPETVGGARLLGLRCLVPAVWAHSTPCLGEFSKNPVRSVM